MLTCQTTSPKQGSDNCYMTKANLHQISNFSLRNSQFQIPAEKSENKTHIFTNNSINIF